MCFTGKGKSSPRCDICLGVGHGAGVCPFREEQEEESSLGWQTRDKGQGANAWPRCRRFNEGNYTLIFWTDPSDMPAQGAMANTQL